MSSLSQRLLNMFCHAPVCDPAPPLTPPPPFPEARSVTTIVVLAFVAVLVAVGVWLASARDAPAAPASPATAATDAAVGRSPHPRIDVLDVAGQLRFVDLRQLPATDLAIGRGLALATEVLRVEPPIAAHVWVVPVEVAQTWCSLEPIALHILASRLRDAHKVDGPDLLLAPGHEWNEADALKMRAAQLEVLVPSADPERGAAAKDALARLASGPRETGAERPVLACTQHGSAYLKQDLVVEIDAFVFVDFRRATPAALENLAALSWVEQPLAQLDRKPQLAVWIVAPWVLALWQPRRAEVLAKLRALQAALPPQTQHRLVAYGGDGERDFVAALRTLGMSPLAEELAARTASTTFQIPLLTLLRDCAMSLAARADKPPERGAVRAVTPA